MFIQTCIMFISVIQKYRNQHLYEKKKQMKQVFL